MSYDHATSHRPKTFSYFIVVVSVCIVCAYMFQRTPININGFIRPPNDVENEEFSLDALDSNSHELERMKNFSPIKNILLWNNSYGYRFGTGRQTFVNNGCRVSNCLITYNSTLMPHSQFDAFLVHPPTINGPYVLKSRRPDQMFVMFSTEPPVHMKYMEKYEDYFNWTISYRTGSTFRLKYGEIIPLESAPQTDLEIMALRTIAVQSAVNPAKGKTKLAVWMVTNCKARSNRQGYVKALMKHLKGSNNQKLLDIFSWDGCEGGQNIVPEKRTVRNVTTPLKRNTSFTCRSRIPFATTTSRRNSSR